MERERVDLTGLWQFQPDPCDEGERDGWSEPAHETRLWREVRVPCDFGTCLPGLESYEGAGWFRQTFQLPPDWEGSRVVLEFDGANYRTAVWVNGERVGAHPDGFLGFEIAVTDVLRPGEENTVAVRVDNTRREADVPGRQRGWRPYGGILRPVHLLATNPLHVDAPRIRAYPATLGGHFKLDALAVNDGTDPVTCRLAVEVEDPQGAACGTFTSGPAHLDPGKSATLSVGGGVSTARPWSPPDPVLYTSRVRLLEDEQVVDESPVRFGFRRVEVGSGGILLNGEQLFLTGFNRHEDSAQRGMCTDLDAAREDFEKMKEAGANFVRLCHYPHSAGELDLCDELGLLVMAEIPLYWWGGSEGEQGAAGGKLGAAKRQLLSMMRRDYNHPSIILWSVSNETQERHPEVASGNAELIRLAQAVDPTRPAVHVSHQWWTDEADFSADDVLCVNGYPSWAAAEREDEAVDAAARRWTEKLEQLREQHPHRPILVTEFGHPALEGARDCSAGEDRQSAVIEKEFTAICEAGVCGATVWCWADHPWPEEDFIALRRVTTSPFGVLSRERRQKKGYGTIKRLFRRKQGMPADSAGEVAEAGPAGLPVVMVRPHMEDIPQAEFPPGFGIRPMRRGEAGLWMDIQRDAEPYMQITEGLFERQFGDDPAAQKWRCFFIVTDRDVAVGTISAWYSRDFMGRDYGRIHWVATRPACQRKGLGKAGLTYAMNRLAEWHDRCYLDTATARTPAIKMYLDYGFRPHVDAAGAREAWGRVREELDHPALESLEL